MCFEGEENFHFGCEFSWNTNVKRARWFIIIYDLYMRYSTYLK